MSSEEFNVFFYSLTLGIQQMIGITYWGFGFVGGCFSTLERVCDYCILYVPNVMLLIRFIFTFRISNMSEYDTQYVSSHPKIAEHKSNAKRHITLCNHLRASK